VLARRDERRDHVRHLAAHVVQRLHRVAGDLVLAPAGAGGVERALGDRVADGARLLDDRDLILVLE
jgi:hypothetical protein